VRERWFLSRKPGSASVTNKWASVNLSFAPIRSPAEFENGVLRIRLAHVGGVKQKDRFLQLMYYFLGWTVGDAGKTFSTRHEWARFQLQLCRGHEENLALGNSVMDCITQLGVPWSRIVDALPNETEPHGAFKWNSYFSEVFLWFHVSCLGLAKTEVTSHHPVKMNWLLLASPEYRLWFLRGLADSDGSVNIRNKTVTITSEPNVSLIKDLLTSLNANPRQYWYRGSCGISITVAIANTLWIFSPFVDTHRGKLLRKLANARVFPRKWPNWLDLKVKRMILQGRDPSSIRNAVLDEHNVYVKLRSIKSRVDSKI
jgi:hypothetical protein